MKGVIYYNKCKYVSKVEVCSKCIYDSLSKECCDWITLGYECPATTELV